MQVIYVVDYLIFTFFASFGVLQTALAKGSRFRISSGAAIVILAYLWFFASRNRNVHTVVEGTQLLSIFIIGAFLAVVVTKLLNFLVGKK